MDYKGLWRTNATAELDITFAILQENETIRGVAIVTGTPTQVALLNGTVTESGLFLTFDQPPIRGTLNGKPGDDPNTIDAVLDFRNGDQAINKSMILVKS